MKLFRSLALLFGLILVLITTVFEISRRDAKIPSAWLTFNVMTVSQTLNYNYSGPIYWALPDGDLWRMRLGVGQYACLRWSPDGRQMLFGIGGSAVRGSFNYYDINRVYANGSHVQRLISFGPHSTNDCPAWSPDGKWIAFTGSENGVWGIYRMHPDGSDMQLVNAGNGWGPGWSPDSQWITFVGGEIPYQIYRVRRDGNDLQPLTALAWTSSPVWSPDGRWVIFVGRADDSTWDYQVFQMRPDGSDFRVRGDALAPTSSSLSLSWSPDGHWFTLVNPKGRLYRAEIEGDRVEDLGVTGWYPVWSPDGHWIAFFSDMGGTYEVYRMHPDGSDVRQVTHFRANLRELVWKPPIETHFSGILLLSTGAFCLVIGSIMPECVYRQVRVRAILQIHPDPVRDT